MTTKTAAEQAASFITSNFKDGVESDGSPTEQEAAAAAADAAKGPESSENDAAEGQEQESAEGSADEGAEAAEGAENQGENGPEGSAKPDAKAPKGGKKSASERIGDITANWRSEQRRADTEKSRADRAEAELAALKGGKAPLTGAQSDAKSGAAPPDPSQFDYGELDPKYIAALARHETAQALAAKDAKDEESRQAAAADAKRQEVAGKTDALVKAGVALHDDFDEVVMQGAQEGRWELTPTLGELLLDSEFGPHIAYELASNPAESNRVAKLSPAQQAAWLGRQEAKFEAAKPSQARQAPKTPQAQTPPKLPKGGAGSNKVGADSQDFAAVEAAWKSGALR